jgi:hypothetical protein
MQRCVRDIHRNAMCLVFDNSVGWLKSARISGSSWWLESMIVQAPEEIRGISDPRRSSRSRRTHVIVPRSKKPPPLQVPKVDHDVFCNPSFTLCQQDTSPNARRWDSRTSSRGSSLPPTSSIAMMLWTRTGTSPCDLPIMPRRSGCLVTCHLPW